MHLYKAGIEGTYKPTLFSLNINKKDVLDDTKRIKDEYGNIFFHEYIHYLQDILTSFGLRNIAKLVREFSVVNHEIIVLRQSFFTIPFKSANKGILLEAELFRLIWGTQELDNDDRDFEVIRIESQLYLLNPALSNHSLISVNILYRDNSEEDAFYLGAIHFMESMAHILERSFDVSQEATSFPYKVIQKITKAVFDKGNFSDRNLILIIEAALESHDPANYYYSFYQFCMQYNRDFDEETILLFRDGYRMTWDNTVYRYSTFYYTNATLARDAFKAMFNHEKLQSLNRWGKLLLANAIKIKRSGFSFTELLATNGDREKVIKNTSRLIRRLGTPIMSDRNYGIFLSSPDNNIPENEMIYLLGIEAVLNILNGETFCSVIPYCSNGQGGADITDRHCYATPWERTKTDPLCLLAGLWIMWGFVRKDTQV